MRLVTCVCGTSAVGSPVGWRRGGAEGEAEEVGGRGSGRVGCGGRKVSSLSCSAVGERLIDGVFFWGFRFFSCSRQNCVHRARCRPPREVLHCAQAWPTCGTVEVGLKLRRCRLGSVSGGQGVCSPGKRWWHHDGSHWHCLAVDAKFGGGVKLLGTAWVAPLTAVDDG